MMRKMPWNKELLLIFSFWVKKSKAGFSLSFKRMSDIEIKQEEEKSSWNK